MCATFQEWDVAAVEQGMTAKAFMNWEAFASLEPWTFYPEVRDDYRAASIRKSVDDLMNLVALVGKGFGVIKGHNQPATIKDLLLKFEEEITEQPPKRKQTLDQQWKILNILAAMHANE